MQRDGRGKPRPDVDYEQVPATNGNDLTLTIDENIERSVAIPRMQPPRSLLRH